mmetsp:Transcript_82405/g.145376  ORF Transcript_82405/g.145376 Transcript_82405/m.145376 type:complete len:386 (-) Transcript_82405:56-1213(-)|eukprot:CAMPEP_0197630046 /NCGR_PEP_ID=MMETSP1338-20131121/7661_1 /TAXON_ID=43686 ORGANISM="Pelagodinium beii, Strain RCC1491" /NCGR_SAMPLE_ID=MMETSP1338 /ASSEMBLY_ACC=CAM_ASM_000754 /LENGTH=385 /DNA_ID=CAMNT_0043201183 /DNA_START=66 /DNA_END=1223 /DNA_ORIENTATION=-
MGCQTSSQSAEPVTKDRRRLSVGFVDSSSTGTEANVADEDRGTVAMLEEKDILNMTADSVGQIDGRKSSITSVTDAIESSFTEKTHKALGDEIDPTTSGLGYTCRKGLKPESPNQDSFSILQVDGLFSLFGVYDGHGKQGHDVSNFVKDTLPKLIVKDKRFKTQSKAEMLKEVFQKTQSLVTTLDSMKRLSAQLSGTTATVAIHDHVLNKLILSHVADSTCVLGEYTDDSKTRLKARALTRDHKPDLQDERSRIEKAGGRVVFDGFANHRVYAKNGRYPGLNMSRCLGDLLGHEEAGCSCVPEVSEVQLGPLSHVLLLCSDGVWEFMTAEEAVNLVAKYPPAQAMMAAEHLAKEAWDRWIHEEDGMVVDDITAIVVHLQPLPQAV